MLSYLRLKDNPRALRTFTSLDQSEFETLLPAFEVAWNAYVYDPISQRKRAKGALAVDAKRVWLPQKRSCCLFSSISIA